jgi:NADPH-dependent 2,4-dienoyl-CoA reductase/sulfur reductase-like enzyme
MTNNKDRTFVVVGASLAGALAVQALREERFDGRVIMIGDEPHPPYERPSRRATCAARRRGRRPTSIREPFTRTTRSNC